MNNWIIGTGTPFGYLTTCAVTDGIGYHQVMIASVMYVATVGIFFAFDAAVLWLEKKRHGTH